MSRFGTVDIGTNTTLLLLAEVEGAEVNVLAERAEITRLGRGIGGDGRLGVEGIERTLAVLSGYARLARQHGAALHAVGTEALRRAPNAAEFLGPAAAILGSPVEVIDGEREAALSFLAARRSFPETAAGSSIVLDIGGGSTEVILAASGGIEHRCSLPVGSVRLTERHVRHDPPLPGELHAARAEVDAQLDRIPFPAAGSSVLVGTAGTVTTLCAMHLGLHSYDPAVVHGFRLPLHGLRAQLARLARSTQPEREAMPGLDPRRADVILCGAVVLLAIAERAGASEILVSDRGIRWGLLHERSAPGGPGVAGPAASR